MNSISRQTALLHFIARSGQVAVFLLLIFAIHLFKLPLSLLRYGLLHIPSGLDLSLKFFQSWQLYWVASRIFFFLSF